MEEDQEMERFGMENDYEDGQWIGGEFYGKRRQKRGPQTKEDVLYGVFAASSDSDSDSKTKKRKRMKGQSKNIDLSKSVNFVSSLPSQELNLQDPQKDNKREKEKEKLMKRNESDCMSVVGEFEKHTKGIGMKLLEKFGYKKGGGLGKNQQGIVAPIEVNLRPKNVGMGFSDKKKQAVRPKEQPDEEKLPPLSTHTSEVRSIDKSWSKHAVKKKKPVYELLTQKQERGIGKVIDMRGPEVRVLTDLRNLNADVPMPDLAEHEIPKLDKDPRNERERVEALHKEKEEELQNNARLQKQQLENLEVIASVLGRIDKLISSSGCSLTLESLAKLFVDLQTRFPDEYTKFDLSCIAFDYARPLFIRNFQGWDPLQNPTHGVELVSIWKKLLQQGKKDSSGSTSPYVQLLEEVVVPAVRKCATGPWPVRAPKPMIRFLESWGKLLPPAMLQIILDIVIVPKISAAVDLWDPRRETIPIHLWVHLLGHEKLENCFDKILQRFSSVLRAWHPSDMSAHDMLSPWKTVFNPARWEHLMDRYIVPTLIKTVIHELPINPADKNLDQFCWVRTWVTEIPTHRMLELMDTFFNKWQQVLYDWLCSENPNFEEVSEWYLRWKEQLPPELQANEHIKHRLKFGLHMMNQAIEGMEVPPPEKQRQFETKKAIEKPKEVISEGFSLKEVIERYAQDNGLLFKPKPGRMQDGHQVFEFGNISIFFVDSRNPKVFAQNEERWSLVSLEQLRDLHNRKRH